MRSLIVLALSCVPAMSSFGAPLPLEVLTPGELLGAPVGSLVPANATAQYALRSVSPDSGWLLFYDYGRNTAYLCDRRTGTLVQWPASWQQGDNVYDLSWSQDGGHLVGQTYSPSSGEKWIVVNDLVGGADDIRFRYDGRPLALTGEMKLIVITGDGGLAAIDLSSGRPGLPQPLAVEGMDSGGVINAAVFDGDILYVERQLDGPFYAGQLCRLQIEGGAARLAVAAERPPRVPLFTQMVPDPASDRWAVIQCGDSGTDPTCYIVADPAQDPRTGVAVASGMEYINLVGWADNGRLLLFNGGDVGASVDAPLSNIHQLDVSNQLPISPGG
jgi:hypothetical protein